MNTLTKELRGRKEGSERQKRIGIEGNRDGSDRGTHNQRQREAERKKVKKRKL